MIKVMSLMKRKDGMAFDGVQQMAARRACRLRPQSAGPEEIHLQRAAQRRTPTRPIDGITEMYLRRRGGDGRRPSPPTPARRPAATRPRTAPTASAWSARRSCSFESGTREACVLVARLSYPAGHLPARRERTVQCVSADPCRHCRQNLFAPCRLPISGITEGDVTAGQAVARRFAINLGWSTALMPSPLTHDQLDAALAASGYLADETLVTALYLALELGKPLLLEGAPGVGKTEVANRLAAILGAPAASACSATRASTPRRRSTTGTMRASFCMCASPSAAARSAPPISTRRNS